MIKFEHPEALWALLLLIPFTGMFLWFMASRKRALRALGDERLIHRLTPDKPTSKHQIKFILFALAYTFLVLALANLQLGRKFEKVKRQGVDLMIAIDISESMLANDLKPNRLAQAKQFVSHLIDELSGDRVGLIIFAGNAYLQVPLTTDYVAVKSLLKTIDTDLAPTQGTAIGAAIRLADEAFEEGQTKYKALLIISDGENHEGDALEAAREAAEKGMLILTVGVGSPEGSPIPIYRGGRPTSERKRDRNGSIVFSKLNEPMLQQIAATGGGNYFRLTQGSSDVKAVVRELESMEQKDIEERMITDYEHKYQWFLAIAILLLTIEYFITEKRNRMFSDWRIFQSRPRGTGQLVIFLLLSAGLSTGLKAQIFQQKEFIEVRKGNKAYQQGDYVKAEQHFRKADSVFAQNLKAKFNLGASVYRLGRYQQASEIFEEAARLAPDSLTRAMALHNMGNALMQLKEYPKSVEAYKQALRLNPRDEDTRYNLAYALQMMQQDENDQQDQQKMQPSEYAKKLKAQADTLVLKRQYQQAYQLMQQGLRQDETVGYYNDFITRLGEILGIKADES